LEEGLNTGNFSLIYARPLNLILLFYYLVFLKIVEFVLFWCNFSNSLIFSWVFIKNLLLEPIIDKDLIFFLSFKYFVIFGIKLFLMLVWKDLMLCFGLIFVYMMFFFFFWFYFVFLFLFHFILYIFRNALKFWYSLVFQ
jgi:hypothetical protein